DIHAGSPASSRAAPSPHSAHGGCRVSRPCTATHPLSRFSPMAKPRIVHRCTECGAAAPKWAGRCSSCEAWNSLVEEIETDPVAMTVGSSAVAMPLAEFVGGSGTARPTGIDELDRVLGDGLVGGSVVLVGGEP